MGAALAEAARAAVVVINPSGNRTRVPLDPLPFTIGRQGTNNLVLRDNRASRMHARIVREGRSYVIEDLQSRHGIYVNGERVTRQALASSDRIDFGFQDGYRLIFTAEDGEIHRILEQLSVTGAPAPSNNLAKLRALVEVARALQSSLSTEEVLTAVVDAALTVTNAERGFLLLRTDEGLDVRVARDRSGAPLPAGDLRVPTSVINRALRTRRELLSMNFDPLEMQGIRPEMSVADLELRSVICVPLIHVRTGSSQETLVSSVDDTVGLLYMDSRQNAADLSTGNREILQTLALEASTILENARLLSEEREKQRMEEELDIARTIQLSLLPRELPRTGWLRAAASSTASHQVGGDYFDMRRLGPDAWVAIVADVSGKGVSSALLASLLQGAFVAACDGRQEIAAMMARLNTFLYERAQGEKYATVFYCTINRDGLLRWSNAGHPKPMLLCRDNGIEPLATTGLPIGMLDAAQYGTEEVQLSPGDKIVVFSDGLSEAENEEGQTFDRAALPRVLRAHRGEDCGTLHRAITDALEDFTEGSPPQDDVTLMVLEYAG